MYQSCAILSKRPKCANLAQAVTNALETIGNRPLKLYFSESAQALHLLQEFLQKPEGIAAQVDLEETARFQTSVQPAARRRTGIDQGCLNGQFSTCTKLPTTMKRQIIL